MEQNYNFTNGVKPLTSSEVSKQIEKGLVNRPPKKKVNPYVLIALKNTFTFFNMLLLFIAIVLFIVGRWSDTFFLAIVFANTAIGIIQEIKAQKKIKKLNIISQNKVCVIRDNKEVYIEPSEVVLNDILFVKSGTQLCCDCEIIDNQCFVNESILTGESNEILKTIGQNLLSGTIVVRGYAYCRASKVGADTYASKLESKAKYYKPNESLIFKTVDKIIKYITLILIPLTIATFIQTFLKTESAELLGEMGKITISTATTAGSVVSMIPSGLFLLTSIALAKGVISLSYKSTIVNNLYSIEYLARVTTLCFDKTGTLTTDKLLVNGIDFISNKEETKDIFLNFIHAFKDANITMQCLQNHYKDVDYKKFEISNVEDFSSKTKSSSVTINGIKYTLGAPDYVYDFSAHPEFKNKLRGYQEQGLRVLFFVDDKNNLLAFVKIEEEIRKDVTSTIQWFAKNDVKIKIISGDDLETVMAIAKRTGVPNYHNGISLKGKSIEETKNLAKRYTIFARVSPEQKLALVEELQRCGEFVGMTGDGVNDLLALKKANCSIALGEGNQATKTLSDIILMKSNFNALPSVVKEGRRVINNIQLSSSLFLSRTFFTISFTFLILIINLNPNLDMSYPFVPRNLYLVSFCGIGAPSFLIAMQPNNDLVKPNFIKKMLMDALPGAISMLTIVMTWMLMKNNNTLGIDFSDDVVNSGFITGIIITLLVSNLAVLGWISFPFKLGTMLVFLLVLVVGSIYIFAAPYLLGNLTYQISGINFLYMTKPVIIATAISVAIVPFVVVGLSLINKLLQKKLLDEKYAKFNLKRCN